MIPGYLINLYKRPDRLKRFQDKVRTYLPDIQINIIEAIDGGTLDLNNEELIANVNPWNFKHLNQKTLRGVIGCCLSHLKCYKKIIDNSEPYAVIFEDDCYFIPGQENMANDIIKNLKLPNKFGVIWLNKWNTNMDSNVVNNLRLVLDGYKTCESYIVSKEFAKILYDENIKNIGAIDAHIGQLFKKYPQYPCYAISNDIFIQFNRADSNIR